MRSSGQHARGRQAREVGTGAGVEPDHGELRLEGQRLGRRRDADQDRERQVHRGVVDEVVAGVGARERRCDGLKVELLGRGRRGEGEAGAGHQREPGGRPRHDDGRAARFEPGPRRPGCASYGHASVAPGSAAWRNCRGARVLFVAHFGAADPQEILSSLIRSVRPGDPRADRPCSGECPTAGPISGRALLLQTRKPSCGASRRLQARPRSVSSATPPASGADGDGTSNATSSSAVEVAGARRAGSRIRLSPRLLGVRLDVHDRGFRAGRGGVGGGFRGGSRRSLGHQPSTACARVAPTRSCATSLPASRRCRRRVATPRTACIRRVRVLDPRWCLTLPA